MKKLIILLVAFLMLVLCNATVSQAVTLSFDPAFQGVLLGNQVDVNVVISGLGNYSPDSLSVFDMDISFSFDSTFLAFTSVAFGSYLGSAVDDSDYWDYFFNPFPSDPYYENAEALSDYIDYGTGQVKIWEISLLPVSELDALQPSNFTLATLTFDTLALGTSPLSISINSLGDSDGLPLTTYSLESGSINVVLVPEPATLFLLGTGLAGIGFLRKKRMNQVSS